MYSHGGATPTSASKTSHRIKYTDEPKAQPVEHKICISQLEYLFNNKIAKCEMHACSDGHDVCMPENDNENLIFAKRK